MELRVHKEVLYPTLQALQGLVDRGELMPILSHVLMEVKNNSLRVAATNLQVSMENLLERVDVLADGITAVPCRKLFQFVRELPLDVIHIRVTRDQNSSLAVSCRDVTLNLKALDPDQFPSFPSIPEDRLVDVSSSLLAEMIDKVVHAIASEQLHTNLSGLHVERLDDRGKIRFVATDGHRLSLIDRQLDLEVPREPSPIVPKKGVLEIRRMLCHTQTVAVGFHDAHMVVRMGGSTVFIRLVDAIFPSYREVIPRFGANRARVKRESLLSAIRKASILASQTYFPSVEMEFTKDRLTVSSRNPEVGEIVEFVDVDYMGSPLSVLFNPKYVSDVLVALDCEAVLIEINDNSSPAVLKDPEDEDFLAVIMPMRL